VVNPEVEDLEIEDPIIKEANPETSPSPITSIDDEEIVMVDLLGNEHAQKEESDAAHSVPPHRSVVISSTLGDSVNEGEAILLTSELFGFDGLTVSYQWQCRSPGNEWMDILNATEASYTYYANAETLQLDWRLLVSFNE